MGTTIDGKVVRRLAVVTILAAWHLVGQNPLVYDYNCGPSMPYPAHCEEHKYIRNGIAYSWMTAVCTNDVELDVQASAQAVNCDWEISLDAWTDKYSSEIHAEAHTNVCSPDSQVTANCNDDEANYSGGCSGPCAEP